MFFYWQPGYLHKLLPDSAPTHPDSLENLFDGEVLQLGYQIFGWHIALEDSRLVIDIEQTFVKLQTFRPKYYQE